MWSKHSIEIKLDLVDLHFSHNAARLSCDLFAKTKKKPYCSAHFQKYMLNFTSKFTGVYSSSSEIKMWNYIGMLRINSK